MKSVVHHIAPNAAPWELVYVIPARISTAGDLDAWLLHLESIHLETESPMSTRIVGILAFTGRSTRRIRNLVSSIKTELPLTILLYPSATESGWLTVMRDAIETLAAWCSEDPWINICEPFMIWNPRRHAVLTEYICNHSDHPIYRVSNNVYPSKEIPLAHSVAGVMAQVTLGVVGSGLAYLVLSSYLFRKSIWTSFQKSAQYPYTYLSRMMFSRYMYRRSRVIEISWSAYFPILVVSPFDRAAYKTAMQALRASQLLRTEMEWAAVTTFALFYDKPGAAEWEDAAKVLRVEHITHHHFKILCKHPIMRTILEAPRLR